MRCSAKRVTKHKVTFSFVNGSASGTYTSSPPAGGAVSLRLGQAWLLTSPGGQFTTKPLLRSPQGEAKVGVVQRGQLTNGFYPNTETFSALHPTSVTCLSRLARSPGGLGGRSRIEFIVSPLPRRRHNESHFAAQPPERSFFFPLFLYPRKKKRLLSATQSQNLRR